jgi:protein associated with RNAse G/E
MSDFQERMYNEVSKYNKEYKNAIKSLLSTKDINDVISPLTALITQYIENSLKSFLQDYIEIKETAHSLQIDNHNLKGLIALCNEKYERYD